MLPSRSLFVRPKHVPFLGARVQESYCYMATDLADGEGDPVCPECEGSGANVLCNGGCSRSFHDACAGVTADDALPKEWQCKKCSKISVRTQSTQCAVMFCNDVDGLRVFQRDSCVIRDNWYCMLVYQCLRHRGHLVGAIIHGKVTRRVQVGLSIIFS